MAGNKILIIDDSPTVLEMLRSLFEEKGFEVVTAATGEEGVDMAESEKVDLAIIDTQLPGIDGFESCRRIKKIKHPAAPKAIIITGTIDAVDVTKARANQADDYVVKTSDYGELLNAVYALIKK